MVNNYNFGSIMTRTNKLLNWLNDNQIDKMDNTEHELLEKSLKEHDIITIFNKQQNLDTLHDERFDKNSEIYNLLFGYINDPNNDNEVESNHGSLINLMITKNKIGCTENIKAVLPSFGDIIKDLYIVIPDEQNINTVLTSLISIEIGPNIIIESTILFTNFIALLFNKKIEKKDSEIHIPVPLSKLLMNARIDINSIGYMQCIINIKYEVNKNVNINKIYAKYSFIESRMRVKTINEPTTMITFMNNIRSFPSNNIIKFAMDTVICPIFIMLWYIIDDSYFAEYQILQPKLLCVNLDVHLKDQIYNKTIDSVKIKKINNGKYTAYVVPVNNMTYDELISFIKESHRDTNKYVNKLWQNVGSYIDVNLEWDNKIEGELVIEVISLNIGVMSNGMFGYKYVT